MEKMPERRRFETAESETRTEDITRLVDRIAIARDFTVAHLCLVLLSPDLDQAQINRLVNIICAEQGIDADETVFNTVHRLPNLPAESRDALLERIVSTGDKTLCNETLLFVPNLGRWEETLRQVLYN